MIKEINPFDAGLSDTLLDVFPPNQILLDELARLESLPRQQWIAENQLPGTLNLLKTGGFVSDTNTPTPFAQAWLEQCKTLPLQPFLQEKLYHHNLRRYLRSIISKICGDCPNPTLMPFPRIGANGDRSYDDVQLEIRMQKLNFLDKQGAVTSRGHDLLKQMYQNHPGELIDGIITDSTILKETYQAAASVKNQRVGQVLDTIKPEAIEAYFTTCLNYLIPKIAKDSWAIILTKVSKGHLYDFYYRKLVEILKQHSIFAEDLQGAADET